MNKRSAALILCTVIFGVLCVGVALLAREVAEKKRMQEYATAREILRERLDGLLRHRVVLEMAARFGHEPGNQALAACLFEKGTCTTTDPKQQEAFVVRKSVEEDTEILAGSSAEPALYDPHGRPGCDDPEDCSGWQVVAWFWASCPDQAPSCPRAEKIFVRHQVIPRGETQRLAASPPEEVFARDPTLFATEVAL